MALSLLTRGTLGRSSITSSEQVCNLQPFPNTWKRGTQKATLSPCAVFSKWIWKKQCIFYFPWQTPWHLRLMILCKIISGLDKYNSGALVSQTAFMCGRTRVIIVCGMCHIFLINSKPSFI